MAWRRQSGMCTTIALNACFGYSCLQITWRVSYVVIITMAYGSPGCIAALVFANCVTLVFYLCWRGKSARQTFVWRWRNSKAAGTILLTFSSLFFTADLLAVTEGLEHPKARKQIAWLNRLMFTPAMMIMMIWRCVEGVIVVVLIHVVKPLSDRCTGKHAPVEVCHAFIGMLLVL